MEKVVSYSLPPRLRASAVKIDPALLCPEFTAVVIRTTSRVPTGTVTLSWAQAVVVPATIPPKTSANVMFLSRCFTMIPLFDGYGLAGNTDNICRSPIAFRPISSSTTTARSRRKRMVWPRRRGRRSWCPPRTPPGGGSVELVCGRQRNAAPTTEGAFGC